MGVVLWSARWRCHGGVKVLPLAVEDAPALATLAEMGEKLSLVDTSDTNLMVEALRCFGLKVDQLRPLFEKSPELNKLLAYVGEQWHIFKFIWPSFKRGLQTGGSFTERLAKFAPTNISHLCNLCTRLYELAFLTSYKYLRAPQSVIHATVSALPAAQSFFSGEWFERYLFTEVLAAFQFYCEKRQLSKHLNYINDTVVILPDEKVAELDLFFEVDGLYFWIEAKTSDYQNHIDKYNRMAKMIGFQPSQVMLVCLDVLEETCQRLVEPYSHLTVLNQYMVRDKVVKLLEASFGTIEAIPKKE